VLNECKKRRKNKGKENNTERSDSDGSGDEESPVKGKQPRMAINGY